MCDLLKLEIFAGEVATLGRWGAILEFEPAAKGYIQIFNVCIHTVLPQNIPVYFYALATRNHYHL